MLIACHDCGLVHSLPDFASASVVTCTRCGGVLRRYRPDGISRALALEHRSVDPVQRGQCDAAYDHEPCRAQAGRHSVRKRARPLSAGNVGACRLVLLVAIVFPFVRIAGSLWVLWHLRVGRLNGTLAPALRAVEMLRPWAMTEVYLLGLIVAWVKLRDLATIDLGVALIAFVTFIVVTLWAGSALDVTEVWNRISPQARATDAGTRAETHGWPATPAVSWFGPQAVDRSTRRLPALRRGAARAQAAQPRPRIGPGARGGDPLHPGQPLSGHEGRLARPRRAGHDPQRGQGSDPARHVSGRAAGVLRQHHRAGAEADRSRLTSSSPCSAARARRRARPHRPLPDDRSPSAAGRWSTSS